jgi:hypothetical protein
MDVTINEVFADYKHNVCLPKDDSRINFLFMNTRDDTLTAFDRIILALKAKGWEPPVLQKKLRIRSQHWNNWRTRGVPHDKLFLIADILDVHPSWLNTGDDRFEPGWLHHDGIIIEGEYESMPDAKRMMQSLPKVKEKTKLEVEEYWDQIFSMCRKLISDGYYPGREDVISDLVNEAFGLATKYNYPDISIIEELLRSKGLKGSKSGKDEL